jgi:hypothetical protein
MPATLMLNSGTWDLEVDSSGNIALAKDPGSLAQDAASAIKTFLGELYFDTTVGVPYLAQILGLAPSIALLKQRYVAAALTVPGVGGAQCFLSGFDGRVLSGQIQVRSAATGQTAAANFATIDPTVD